MLVDAQIFPTIIQAIIIAALLLYIRWLLARFENLAADYDATNQYIQQLEPVTWDLLVMAGVVEPESELERHILDRALGVLNGAESNDELRFQLRQVRAAYERLMDYRRQNTLNFQLEKADDHLREIGEALGDGSGDPTNQ